LNAAASVPGSFTYDPTNGAVLATGTNTLSVAFTPADALDYSPAADEVSLVVSPAPLTITAANASRSYGQTNPLFSGTIVGLTNGDLITVSYSCGATPTSPPGTYPIVPSLVDPSDLETNYTVSLTNGTLTVTPLIPPTITSVCPDSGLTNGGTSVTILGTGFATGATVSFGAVPAAAVNVVNSTNLTAVAPPSTLGTVSILLTNADGLGTVVTNAFSYVAPPATVVQVAPPAAATITIAWSATSGQTYQVQFTTNLAQPNWTDLGIVTATNSTATISDTLGASSQRFYRTLWLP
jgi:hypothetical protein